jgi:hypothetical protein
MYRLVTRPNAGLPRLAWCAVVTPSAATVEVSHGEAVECGDDFWVEGAWDGEFTAGAFADALLFMGSGAKLTADGVVFSTASHTVEALYYARIDAQVYFSNSLPFLLASAELTLDVQFPHYLSILTSSRFGLERYSKTIPTAEGIDVTMLLHCSATIDASGRIATAKRRLPDEFRDYHHFRSFVVDGLAALWENARAPERSVRYGMLSTTSSGYDSVAISVLARDVGCTDTITFAKTARGEDDSGERIARRLGMNVHTFDRDDCRTNERAVLEVVACGDSDIQLAACEDILGGNLLLTGYSGDRLWDREFKPLWRERTNTPLVRTDVAGASLQEFRLRVGFIQVPVALFALSRDRSIWEITGSEEMKPWTLGTVYDRPIPRRIAEEAGIPREWFGQKKKVTVLTFTHKATTLHPGLAKDYRRFLQVQGCKTNAPIHNAAAKLLYWSRRFARLLDKLHVLPTALRVPTYVAPPVPIRFMHPIDERSYLIPWAAGALREKYARAIRSGAKTD